MNHLRLALVVSCLGAALHFPALGQVGANPVGQGSGPLRDLSTNVRAGSGTVRGSVSDAPINAGALSDRSVRGSVTGNVVSGPVSEISAGAVTASRPVAGGGSVAGASVGAVKKDTGSPLGAMISQPLRELGPLQEQLRAIQPLPRNAAPPAEDVAPAEAAADTGATDVATQPEEPAEEGGSEEATTESPSAAPELYVEGDTAEQSAPEPEEVLPPEEPTPP